MDWWGLVQKFIKIAFLQILLLFSQEPVLLEKFQFLRGFYGNLELLLVPYDICKENGFEVGTRQSLPSNGKTT